MPMKWDAENDRTLFFLVFKNLGVNVDAKTAKLIADQWPQDQAEKPTPRAISERFIKVRSSLNKPGNGIISQLTSGTSTPRKPTTSTTSTPRKPPTTANPASKKRKLKTEVDNDDDDEDFSNHVSAREVSALDTPTYRRDSGIFATHTSSGLPLVELASPNSRLVQSIVAGHDGSREVSPSPASRAGHGPGRNGYSANGYASPKTASGHASAAWQESAAASVGRLAVHPESPATPRARVQRAASSRVLQFVKQEAIASGEETVESGAESDVSEYHVEMEV